MAKLIYKYGAMGSAKTANALMTHFNCVERNLKTLLVKPKTDTRDGERMVASRVEGLATEAIFFEEFEKMPLQELSAYDVVVIDEAQFLSCQQVDFLADVVDFAGVEVICFGLRADFRNLLFEGSARLLVLADVIEEIKTYCWCGEYAICNARFNEHGEIIREGEQVVMGGNDKYISLCRKHHKLGQLGPVK